MSQKEPSLLTHDSKDSDNRELKLPRDAAARFGPVSCIKASEGREIWLGKDRENGKSCIIKTAKSPAFVSALRNERDVLDRLHREGDERYAVFPSVLYFSADISDESAESRADSKAVLIRSCVQGISLEELCETCYEKPGLPVRESLDYLIDIAEQLILLHSLEKPVIHRDIKPQNVILDPLGTCHLIDFGISRSYEKDAEKESDTDILGTRVTAPPEQFGYRETDTRSDLYSAGVLLYYCLTGDYRVSGLEKTDLPEAVKSIIRKATMFDPDRRYQNAEDLLLDLVHERYAEMFGSTDLSALMNSCGSAAAARGVENASAADAASGFPEPLSPEKQTKIHSVRQLSMSAVSVFVLIGIIAGALLGSRFSSDRNTGSGDRHYEQQSAANEAIASDSAENPDAEYIFTEPFIEEAVRKILEKPEGTITRKDLRQITALHIFGRQIYDSESEVWYRGSIPYFYTEEIESSRLYMEKGPVTSLEDIRAMPNLWELCIYNQQITDLTPISGTKVARLGIGLNPLKDLTQLEGNSRIQYLNICGLELHDTESLETLENLHELIAGGTALTSLAGLAGMKINTLDLCEIDLADPADLLGLPSLEKISVTGLSAEMVDVLHKLPVKDLTVTESCGFHLYDLNGMDSLERLYFWDTALPGEGEHYVYRKEELKADFPSLRRLTLNNAVIEDFSFLSGLPVLSELAIYSSECEGYTGLDELPSLRRIEGTPEQAEAIRKMYPDHRWEF